MMKIPVLIYHDVIPINEFVRLHQSKRLYSITCETFNDQLGCLSTQGFQTVQLDNLLHDVPHPVILTFDDGSKSAYWCHQRLKLNGFYGIFFIVTNFIGQQEYLSWDEIREMHTNGMSIQSHTCNHLILTNISTNQIWVELSESKAVIEDKIGGQVNSLSIPHGFVNRKIIDIAEQCGYEYIFTSHPGLYVPVSRYPINRLTIYHNTTTPSFCRIVNQSIYEIGKQKGLKQTLSIPKYLLGDKTYHRVRQQILHWFD